MPTSRSTRRRLTAITISVTLTAGALAVASGPTITAAATEPAASAAEKVLSHFLCYLGRHDSLTSNPEVGLEDQFGSTTATVRPVIVFCNPARKKRGKRVTKIVSAKQHLKGYFLSAPTVPESLKVEVTNQFGSDQLLEVNATPTMLFVPTRKKPHKRPRGLDHFLCYTATGKEINTKVKLIDEFRKYKRVRVVAPVFQCNPVKKTHSFKISSIKHREAHLVCYSIKPRKLKPRKKRFTVNQFQRSFIRAKTAVVLCVPSSKQILITAEGQPEAVRAPLVLSVDR